MKRPIGLYLAEFGAGVANPPPPVAVSVEAGNLILPPHGDAILLPAPPFTETPDPMIEGEGVTELSVPEPPGPAVADLVAALEADHAAALVAARQQWAEQEGARLAEHLDTALAQLETRILDVLAPLLEPFLVKAAQLKAINELRGALRVLLRSGGQTIAVTGPADLLAALETVHPGQPSLVFAVADTPDVTIAAGETLVRSRLRDWASALEASLGDRA